MRERENAQKYCVNVTNNVLVCILTHNTITSCGQDEEIVVQNPAAKRRVQKIAHFSLSLTSTKQTSVPLPEEEDGEQDGYDPQKQAHEGRDGLDGRHSDGGAARVLHPLAT